MKGATKEICIIIVAAVLLGVCYAYPEKISQVILFSIFFLIIIGINVLAKKYASYYFESKIKTRFWSIYQYGFGKRLHFKSPIFMAWLPILLTLISRGLFLWMPVLEFDIKPNLERVARRHEGIYRFTEMTERHIAVIVMWGIVANLLLAIIGYLLGGVIPGGETFAKLNIYYAFWSLLPLSSLDGAKLFFGSRPIWFFFLVINLLFFISSFML